VLEMFKAPTVRRMAAIVDQSNGRREGERLHCRAGSDAQEVAADEPEDPRPHGQGRRIPRSTTTFPDASPPKEWA